LLMLSVRPLPCLLLRLTPSASLFPYTTLFRSHPDKHPGDTAAENRFKSASEAYSVVGDKEKRKEYDELKSMVASGGMGGGFSGADRKSTRLNSSHVSISYAVFCLKKKNIKRAE